MTTKAEAPSTPHDELESLRDDLAELTALHGPSGAEGPIISRLRELFTPLVDELSVDHMGNLTATRQGGAGQPYIVVSAHADEIGAVVAKIEPEGFLRLGRLGGVQPRLLEGRAVWVNGHPGVIGARSAHLREQLAHSGETILEELFVDLGVDSASEVADLGICIGDPVVVISELRNLAGTRVAGKGFDNRASCVVLLHLLRRLRGQELPCRLTALVTVQEEVGLRGATVAFARLRPDLAIVVDTAPTGDTPDARGLAYPVGVGQGIIIHPTNGQQRGFLMPRAARDVIIAAAERAGVAYQLGLMPGGSTDAGAAHLAAGGIPSLQINIPRRYTHSPVELLDLRDMVATLAVLQELVTHPPTTEDLAFR